ncbi:hypothetical protein AL524_24260 [Citrobacter amalonaticus]|nr:hypothetical protein AL524_24260 [Citrobacter amalonaticus]
MSGLAGYRRIGGKPVFPGEAQRCGGLPCTSTIAANGCHCNTGGDMALTQPGMAFWHDLYPSYFKLQVR